MDKQTRFDKLLTWFKNNRLFAIAMLVAIGIVGASQFVSSLASLVATGEHLFSKSPPASAQSTNAREGTTESEQAPRAPSIATQVLKFGAGGTGPGYFQDPRWIEFSRPSELVIAEFGDDGLGRVQLFDLDGKFITQWFAKERDPQRPGISMMALDPEGGGTLYLEQRAIGEIYRYDLAGNDLGKVGDLLPKSPRDPKVLASDPRGGVVSLWEYVGVDLVRYDHGAASPRLIRPDIFKGHLKDTLSIAVAVDGVGNIYAVSSENSPVFKFSPDGEFLDRFGESGDGPGQWDSPNAIAIDGAGHIVVSGFRGIDVLNANGHYLGRFTRNCGPVRALTFDLNGFLYALCSDAVVKYRLNLH